MPEFTLLAFAAPLWLCPDDEDENGQGTTSVPRLSLQGVIVMILAHKHHLLRLHAGRGLQTDDVGAGWHGPAGSIATVPEQGVFTGGEGPACEYGHASPCQIKDPDFGSSVTLEGERDRGLGIEGIGPGIQDQCYSGR